MGEAQVDMRYLTVHKVHPAHARARAAREVECYQAMPWATPRLVVWGEGWLEVERCTPLLDLAYEQTVKYRGPLRDLLRRVHDAGWWHCDANLLNVVIHPVRGVLLVDWEIARPAESNVSYDLYGASAAGVDPVLVDPNNPGGVHWHGAGGACPGKYWNGA